MTVGGRNNTNGRTQGLALLVSIIAASTLLTAAGQDPSLRNTPAPSPSAAEASNDRVDLVPAGASVYGVEIRADAGAECRIGNEPSDAGNATVRACAWERPTAFAVVWTATEVRLTIGRTTMRRPGRWRVGNAIHLTAAGSAHVNVSRVEDLWARTVVSGDPSSDRPVDAWIGGANLDDGWRISGTIERRQPGPADAVTITVGHDRGPFDSGPKPLTFTGGTSGPNVPVSRLSLTPTVSTAGPTRTWTGATNQLWNVAANWTPAGVPAAGEQLVFGQAGQNRKQTENNMPGLVVGGVTIQQSGYSIRGEGLTLGGGVSSFGDGLTLSSLAGDGAAGWTNNLDIEQQKTTTFRGTLDGGNLNLKSGSGTFTLAGSGTSDPRAQLDSGSLVLSGGSLGETFVNNGTFAADGAAGGTINGNFTFNNGTYIQSISSLSDFHRLTVNGSVALNGALQIHLQNNYTPSVGDEFLIIANDGGDGTNNLFRGLQEGSTVEPVPANGVVFTISGRGGDGNDVVLRVTKGGGPTPAPNLVITKTHSPSTFTAGAEGTYTLTVSNSGNAMTSGLVTVTDTLPAGFAPASVVAPGWSCDTAAFPIVCSRQDSLAPGGSYPPVVLTVRLAANAPSGTNTATVIGGGDTTVATVTDETPVGAGGTVDLAIGKSSEPAQFAQGGQGTYVITVTNIGSAATTGEITVTDQFPAGLTPGSVTQTGWNCTGTQTLTCTRSTGLQPNASSEIRVAVNVSATAPASVTNTVTVRGNGDSNAANDSATVVTPVTSVAPRLTGKKDEATFRPGQTGGTIGLTITNDGNGPTSGPITVADTLPSGFTPASGAGDGWTCAVSAPTVTCTRTSSLGAGSSSSITITVNVAADAASATNVATVSGGGDATEDRFAAPINVIRTATDLTINKSHSGTPSQGGTVTFIVDVGNAGETATTGTVTVTDPLPQGLTYVSAEGGGWSCAQASSTVTCTRSDSLGGGGAKYPAINLTASVGLDVTTAVNTATVSGGGDAAPGNNSDSDTVTFGIVQPQLTIEKSDGGPFRRGQQDATFTIGVRNVGERPTSGEVVVSDNFPAGLTPASASGSGWSCTVSGQAARCTRADALVNGGAYPALTLVAAVGLDATSGINVAEVSGGGMSSGNSTQDPYVVSGPAPSPALTLSKSHTGDFVQGQTGVYTLTVGNSGTGATNGPVTLRDQLPAGLTPASATGGGWDCAIQGPQVTCTRVAPLAPQESSAVTLTVNVSATATGPVLNVATASGGGNATEVTASDQTVITGRPQLTITKSHADPVLQGQQGVQFVLSVINNGTAPSAGAVTVTDALPAGLVPVDATGPGWSCGVTGQAVTCTRADAVAASQAYPPIHVSVNVAADATSATNTATVDGGGDTTPADNSAADLVAISVPGAPNLVMIKQHDGLFAQGQAGAIYRLRVDNRGTAASAGTVSVIDDVPAGLLPIAASGDGWSCSISGQRLTCTRADALAAGTSWPVIQLSVNVSATATNVVNAATLNGGGDGTPADNTASDPTTIGSAINPALPDLRVTKRHEDPFVTGQTGAVYQIAVSNAGAGPTAGEVVLTDTVPAGMTPTSASGAGWQCAIGVPAVTCRRSDVLGPGGSYPDITLLVNVLPSASSAANLATVSGGGDITPGNNTASDFTNVNGSVDASISLRVLSNLLVGTTAEYAASVRSLGPGTISGDTVVTTDLPNTLIPVAGIGSNWQCQTAGQQVRCSQAGTFGPGTTLPELRVRVLVRAAAADVTTSATVEARGDVNDGNDRAAVTSASTQPTVALRIIKTASTGRTMIGGSLGYRVDVANVGDARVALAVLRDLLPRGFQHVESESEVTSTTRSIRRVRAVAEKDRLEWSLGTLSPGETVTVTYRVVVGADARTGLQENRATVSGVGPAGELVSAGPAVATVDVVADTFSLLQAVVGRVYEDADGNGAFTSADRPIANARVITSTGQASITDPDGLYNIPSLGAGSVAVSLDRSTVPGQLTVADNGPGDRSWTRLLRTPLGGGSVLVQNFTLVPATPQAADIPPAVRLANQPPQPAALSDAPAGTLPPRREYESREGASLLVALGEVSFGQAAPEFEVFGRDGDTWGYGSLFLQTPVGSVKNRLTLAYDTHRRLNGTTGTDRLFELDPNDRLYPVFGDTSRRQEFATANAKLFARLERGASYVMYGDLIGDLPSSARDGGRWSSYQRHLTGTEVRLASDRGDGVTVRGAQPTTAFARDIFAGPLHGLLRLNRTQVRPGTETIAVELRDRRLPDRILSRDVLARAVDYDLEPATGTVFLRRHVGGLDSALNLMQIVATYEYETTGLETMTYSGRGWWTLKGLRLGGAYFSEDGVADERFQVAGLDLEQRLPRGGSLRLDLPYSKGVPNVVTSFQDERIPRTRAADGFGLQASVDQPFAFWNGRVTGSLLAADRRFNNPFSSTITPGAKYAAGGLELSPRKPSRLEVGVTGEQYESSSVDAQRTTASGSWSETIAGHVTLTAGYDHRWLEQSDVPTESGLVTGGARVTIGRFEASAAREQNVLDEKDPTYPDQTTLAARFKLGTETTAFYTHRISDSAIVPVGDFAGTGLSRLPTTSELSVGVESRVADATRLTSRYEVDQGISGPDAFAVIGAATQVNIGRSFAASFGGERGELIQGAGDSYTSGTLGLSFLGSDRFKASARYEARERDGFAGLFTAGLATRVAGGITALLRGDWLDADRTLDQEHSMSLLAALAIRPATNDRAGLLFSYQFADREGLAQTFGLSRNALAWRQRLSTDGYLQPAKRFDLHGKFAWSQTSDPQQFVGTYVAQGRARLTLLRLIDAAIEARYIRQQVTHTKRQGAAAEIGFWPIADLRAAVGYSFDDSRDPAQRDFEGRARGVYVTLSTKLSRLFNLMGSAPPAASRDGR